MSEMNVPSPSPMALDRDEWAKQLNLCNFINTYYQYRDLQKFADCSRVLIVGPGQGLDRDILKSRGYDVTAFDIDQTFQPDYIGSVHDMAMFSDQQFDAVIASHVLEHLAEPYLDGALEEISRVGKNALIYLPVHGRHVQLRLIPGFGGLDLSFIIDFFNYFEKPDGLSKSYMSGEHYWEVGLCGFRVGDLVKRMSVDFTVIETYRNRDWLPSQNFILKSKRVEE